MVGGGGKVVVLCIRRRRWIGSLTGYSEWLSSRICVAQDWFHIIPPPTTSIEWGGGTPHACGSERRSGATGVMLSGGDSLTASVPSYLPSSCLVIWLLFISDKIEEYNFLVLVLTYKITTNRPTRSPFYSIENVTLPQAFISLFFVCLCVQFPPF